MTRERRPLRWLHQLGLGRPRPDESAALEVEHHVAELTDRLVAEGLNADEARREAERHFGDRARFAAKMRKLEEASLRGDRWSFVMEMIGRSLVSVARTARREPSFTAAVVLTLGLGIGANATMYGIVDRLLLRPPEHVVEPETVKRVFIQSPNPLTANISTGPTITYPDYLDLAVHSGFADVAVYIPGSSMRTVGSGPNASRARASMVSAAFFQLLGVSPSLGRFFTAEEAAPGSTPITVLGERYWSTAYAADRDVIGRTIEISGRHHTIIGVAPADFTGVDLAEVDVWLPLEVTIAADDGDDSCLRSRGCWRMNAVARLKDGVSVEAAEAEATTLHLAGRDEEIRRERYPYSNETKIVLGSLIAARGPNASQESRVAGWLAATSWVVLLIACANVANLLLARAVRVRRETGVRLSLGATRRRLVTEAIAETLVLALVGAAAAFVVARCGGAALRAILLPNVHFPESALSWRLFGFAVAIAVASGLLAGVAPALRSTRIDLTRDLADGGLRISAAPSKLRRFLTVAQASMCVLLLVGAGLFVRSIDAVRTLDLGLDVDRVLIGRLEFQQADLEPERQAVLYEEAMRRVSTIPGVTSAAATEIPFRSGYAGGIGVPGLDSLPSLPGGGPYEYPVSPRYFETLGLAITSGLSIEAADIANGAMVAVVNETMANMLWPDGNVLGRCLSYRDIESCVPVVGVVEDAARSGFRDAPFMAVYYSASPVEHPYRAMYVRAREDANDIVDDVSFVLRSFSSEVRFADVRTLRDTLDPQARSWTLGATMFSIFGVLALVVAAVGLYSVLAFDVAQRTREIGIRTALGARKGRLLRSVVTQGATLGIVGIALGLAAAYFAAPYIQDLLFETSPRDPTVFATVALVLLVVSIAASLAPALRATRVDPVTALKTD